MVHFSKFFSQVFCLFLLFFFVVLNPAAQAQKDCLDFDLIDSTRICPEVFDPVCGCDGVTYNNSCEALKAGIVYWTQGACDGTNACNELELVFLLQQNFGTSNWTFTDQSTITNGQVLYRVWDFGDGNYSDQAVATHNYAAPGVYLVCLTVKAADANGNICSKTRCARITVSDDCAGHCPYQVTVDHNGLAVLASLTPALQDTPFFFYVLWSLDDGAATGTGLAFNPLLPAPGIHSICAQYPTGDFTADLCTVCTAFELQGTCVDSNAIDSSYICPPAVLPVCGCNGVTYVNACAAYYYGGVSDWLPGECGGVCNNLAVNFDGYNSGGAMTSWTFNDKSSFPGGQVTSWYWDFGNGTFSNEKNPFVQFGAPGDYEVCLTVFGLFADGTQCGSNVCKTFHVAQPCLDASVVDPDKICIGLYEPVCGCDGVTYPNECEAYYHHGVTQWTPGACGFPCIQPNWIDSTATCLEFFDPVCGCDAVTYTNDCFARRSGVRSWTKGPCCQMQNCLAQFELTQLSGNVFLLVNQSFNAAHTKLDFGDGNHWEGVFDTLLYTYNTPGIFQICLEIQNGEGNCTNTYCKTVIVSLKAVHEAGGGIACTVYPNPADGLLHAQVKDTVLESVILTDTQGRTVWMQAADGQECVISTTNIPSGLYFLRLHTEKGSAVRKINILH